MYHNYESFGRRGPVTGQCSDASQWYNIICVAQDEKNHGSDWIRWWSRPSSELQPYIQYFLHLNLFPSTLYALHQASVLSLNYISAIDRLLTHQ